MLPGGDPLNHVEDVQNLSAWQQPCYEPAVYAKMQYDQLLQRNGLISHTTHNRAVSTKGAEDIFTLAKSAHALKRNDIFISYNPSRDLNVKVLTASAANFILENPAPLWHKLLNPGQPFAAQVEKDSLLAIRSLYRSIDAWQGHW